MPRLLSRGGARHEATGRPEEDGGAAAALPSHSTSSSGGKDRPGSPDSLKKRKGSAASAALSSPCKRAAPPLLLLLFLFLFLLCRYPSMLSLRAPLLSGLLLRRPPSAELRGHLHEGGGRGRPMDTFFVSHGMPTLAIDESLPARSFLQSWRKVVLPEQPKAIVMVSAHWDTDVPAVNVVDGVNPTIYDFWGFPRPLYKLKYPAPGAPELAKRVKDLVDRAGSGPVQEEVGRGLDHGAWVPLILMYPEANIPVCQLSIQSGKSAEHHYRMGQALAPLREEGVLIIASGSATHNQRDRSPAHLPPPKWAASFISWLRESLLNGRHEDVNYYIERGSYPKMAHPTPEHFLPLHVAMGAAGEKAKAEVIHESWSHGTLCYDAYRFSAA